MLFPRIYSSGHISQYEYWAGMDKSNMDYEEVTVIDGETGERVVEQEQYYTEDGSVKDEYDLGNAFTVGGNGLELYSLKVDNKGCMFTYRLTDLYGAFHWLPLKAH